jgi:hypothetical protein
MKSSNLTVQVRIDDSVSSGSQHWISSSSGHASTIVEMSAEHSATSEISTTIDADAKFESFDYSSVLNNMLNDVQTDFLFKNRIWDLVKST